MYTRQTCPPLRSSVGSHGRSDRLSASTLVTGLAGRSIASGRREAEMGWAVDVDVDWIESAAETAGSIEYYYPAPG